jgi:S1-C subfamily serine protease
VLPDEGTGKSGRHHAEFVCDDRAWSLVDRGSTHGTYVNGARITRRRLRSGDRLAFGDDELLVESAGAPRRSYTPFASAAAILAACGLAALFWPGRSQGFEGATRRAARSTYLVTVIENGRPRPFATAFAIRPDGLLVTAAHVVRELERRDAIGHGAAIVRFEPTIDRRPILDARAHERWTEGSVGRDVGTLRVAAATPLDPLPLASDRAIARVTRGTPVATLGFPAATTDPAAPRARLATDVIAEVRDNRYVAIDLNIVPGTSGSPIFLENGEVIAIVAGGHFVPSGSSGEFVPSGTGVNWGVTATVLREWLERPQ